MPKERVASCLRVMHQPTVDVLHHASCSKASFRGLVTCGSVWMCPVCAAKISERRKLELRAAIARWEDAGGTVALVTYTYRHHHGEDLDAAIDGIQAARRKLRSGRSAVELRRRFGIAGTCRALEVTHGENGWHVHVHELVFVQAGTEGLEDLAAVLLPMWQEAVVASGLGAPNGHGVRVDLADLAVADYIAKFGHERTWGPEAELTKAVSKRGRVGGRTPAEMLADFTIYADPRAGELWTVYAKAFRGRRQLAWSRGMRELVGLGVEQTDEEIAEETTAAAVVLAQLSRSEWRVVLGNDARAELLEVADNGDASAVKAFLADLAGDGMAAAAVVQEEQAAEISEQEPAGEEAIVPELVATAAAIGEERPTKEGGARACRRPSGRWVT